MLSVATHEPNPDVAISAAPPSPPPPTIFRSRLPDIAISADLPLHAYCFERASDHADRPCLISGATGRTFTYSETRQLSLETAAGLTKLGLRHGDTFMILLQNCPEFVFSFLAASVLGAVATTANPFFTPGEISKQLSSSGAKLVITQASFVDKLPKNLTVIAVDEGDPPKGCLSFATLLGGSAAAEGVASVDDAVALPFSSGTTGLPKGVILTHRSLITGVAQQVDGENPNLFLSPSDVVLCVLPLFHIFSLNSVLLCSLRAGATVLVVPKFEIVSLLSLIERHRVTVAAVVPPIVLALAKNPVVESFDLSSIRIVLSGAAPLGKDLQEALHGRLPQAVFGQGYGMTEAGPVLTMCPAFAKVPFPAKAGSCGPFDAMVHQHGISPQMEHYAALVDLFCRHGCLEEALDIVIRMPLPPGRAVCGALLGACRVHQNDELALLAMEGLAAADPVGSAPYVLLCNMHARVGQWEEAADVREAMEQQGIKKQAGFSWIELPGSTHVFTAGDMSHPFSLQILAAADWCSRAIRDEINFNPLSL